MLNVINSQHKRLSHNSPRPSLHPSDGYMLVRYINVCFKMSLFLTLWGMLVLVPIYSTAQEKHFSWNKYTLANIPNDPSAHQLWIPAISAYIFATYFCHLMYGEYRNFVKKRIQYLVQGDPDTPPQTYYTLMVEKVPVNLRSAPALEAFFENLFPGDVHSVEVALDLKELDMMTRHRRHIRDSLEKAIALSKATGRHQLQWIRKDFYEHTSPLNVVKENRIASFLGFIVVDAVEHRTRVLAELNSLVRILQLATLERRHILDQQETRRQQGKMEVHVGKKVRNFFNAGMSSFLAERDKTVTAARGYFRKYQRNQRPDTELEAGCRFGPSRKSPFLRCRPLRPIHTQEAPIATCLYAINDTKGCFGNSSIQGNFTGCHSCWEDSSQEIIRNQRERKRRVSIWTSTVGVPEDHNIVEEEEQAEEIKVAVDLAHNESKPTSPTLDGTTHSSPLHPPVFVLGEEMEKKKRKAHRTKRRRWKILWGISRFINLSRITGLVIFGVAMEALEVTWGGIRWLLRSLLEGVRTVELLTVGAYYKTSSTAFVTLKSRGAKSSAHQMFLSHVHYSMVVKSAPNPKDCIWENISIPARQIEMRKTIADCCFIVGAVFWSIVVGFITAFANFESLSKELPWLDAYRNTATYDILNQYLAVGVLLILLSLLPFLFDMIARSYEGRKLESEIQNSIMTRYFYYQLANVFVSVGLGSIANSIHQIIQNPSSVLSILGTSLPTLSVYFTNLLIVKSFTAVPLELLRIWPLICVLSVRSWRDKNKCTIRELKKGMHIQSMKYCLKSCIFYV